MDTIGPNAHSIPIKQATREELADMYPDTGAEHLSDRELAIADALDNPHGLYRLGQQHAIEDAVALIRHEAALAGGNRRLRLLADRIEQGEATARGGKRRRGG